RHVGGVWSVTRFAAVSPATAELVDLAEECFYFQKSAPTNSRSPPASSGIPRDRPLRVRPNLGTLLARAASACVADAPNSRRGRARGTKRWTPVSLQNPPQ